MMAEALKLMLTGMSTVFFILIMVVVLGRLIIQITNKVAVVPLAQTVKNEQNKTSIESSKLAAIVSAIETVTKGKGKVTSIEKIKK